MKLDTGGKSIVLDSRLIWLQRFLVLSSLGLLINEYDKATALSQVRGQNESS